MPTKKPAHGYLYLYARSWKQPRCPSIGEWINKLWYIHTMEYYSAVKKKRQRAIKPQRDMKET